MSADASARAGPRRARERAGRAPARRVRTGGRPSRARRCTARSVTRPRRSSTTRWLRRARRARRLRGRGRRATRSTLERDRARRAHARRDGCARRCCSPVPGIKTVPGACACRWARALAPLPDAAPTHEGLVECAGQAAGSTAAHLAPLGRTARVSPSLLDAAASVARRAVPVGRAHARRLRLLRASCRGVARACGARRCRATAGRSGARGGLDVGGTRTIDVPNDLVFWPGHVADRRCRRLALVLHANAHTLSVAVEPLSDVVRAGGRPELGASAPLPSPV